MTFLKNMFKPSGTGNHSV